MEEAKTGNDGEVELQGLEVDVDAVIPLHSRLPEGSMNHRFSPSRMHRKLYIEHWMLNMRKHIG